VVERLRTKKIHPALKHAGYSAAVILPGENRAEFEELYQDLLSEFCPDGPLEHDIVAELARLLWRKQNIPIYRKAEIARQCCDLSASEERPRSYSEWSVDIEEVIAAQCAGAVRASESRARKKLGEDYELVAIGELATPSRLLLELDLAATLDGHIDRCLKRLLHVRGIKSLATTSASALSRPVSVQTKAA